MANSGHAFLSASASKRWLNCPPSARLCESYDDVESDFAAEGTDAHTLCEYKLKKALGLIKDEAVPTLTWYNQEMEDCANSYVAYILEIVEEIKKTCPDLIVLIEQRLDFSKYVKEGFGTGDCVIIADGTLYIIDYKHGRGVEVEAYENPQMKLYALGGLELFDCLYEIDKVSMTIYQPRRANISVFIMDKIDLYNWAEEILKPTAELAYKGKGSYKCGEWCQWCKAKVTCRERASVNMKLAELDFAKPPILTDEEIEEVLSKVDGLVSWANEIKEYCLHEALRGKKWNGWKVVEGRSNRKFSDENQVALLVTKAGYDPYEKKLLGITEMQKRLGKATFEELLEKYVIKPIGKPSLVPNEDKRPEFGISTAKDDFNETD